MQVRNEDRVQAFEAVAKFNELVLRAFAAVDEEVAVVVGENLRAEVSAKCKHG